jgi:phospholipase/carboxylesterase
MIWLADHVGAGMTSSLVILLHGVNATGADLAPLGDLWRKALPDTAFVAPDAPFPTPIGRQWFSLDDVTPENRLARIAAALAPCDMLMREIIADHGLSDRPERVALVGFSQGAMMALDAQASGRWTFGGIVGISGRLASPPPLAPSRATPVLLIHGDDDSVIPCSESREATSVLQSLGVQTSLYILHGVDHCISSEGALLARDYLVERLGRARDEATLA